MQRIFTLIAALIVALIPLTADAHMGGDLGAHHASSAVLQGFLHPFTGADHLLAMLAVGVWSVLSFGPQRRGRWLPPVAFATLLLLGGIVGEAGVLTQGSVIMSAVEPMIAASLLVLGLLVAWRVQLPLPPGAVIVGIFAVFHGLAHGSELPGSALAGMVLATLLLHLAGMALGQWVLARNRLLSGAAGLALASYGLSLIAG